jgi:hypothetical protein
VKSKKRILICGVEINFKMMEENNITENREQQKRPLLLTVLCILTFISTGLSILSSLLIPMLSNVMVEIFKMPQFQSEASPQAIMIIQAGWGYYMIILLLTSFSLTGALMMWNLRKNGFHFYTIANIILFYLPILWFNLPFSLAAAFFPAAFIALYAINLKFMK